MPHPDTPPEIVAGACVGLLSTFLPDAPREKVKAFALGAMSRFVEYDEHIRSDFGPFQYETQLTLEDVPDCKIVRFIPGSY